MAPGFPFRRKERLARYLRSMSAALEAFERRYVEDLLHKHHGNVTRSAREAKQDRRAFGRLVKRHHIDRRAS